MGKMDNFQLNSLIDLSAVRKMTEANYKASGMPIGIIDAIDGTILVATGWQDICVRFHRACEKSLAACLESDNYIKQHIEKGKACQYKCQNGLWDIGIPIIVSDRHLATLFLGQFFFKGEIPERNFFIQQARTLNYDLNEYLTALGRVPVFTHEKVDYIIQYNQSLADFIADLATHSGSIKKAEADLIKSEEKYRRLTENAADVIFRMALPEGRFEYINPASVDLLGYSPEEFYASAFLIQKIIHPDWQNYFKEQMDRLIRGDAPKALEYQIVHRSGETKWLSQRNVLVRNNEGRPIALEGIITDTTDYKLSELSLKYSESFLGMLIDTIPVPVFYKDNEGRYLGFNKAFEDFFGETKDHLIGKSVFDISPRDLAEIYHKKDAELLMNGGIQQYESKVKNTLGEIRDVVFFKGAFTDAGGNIDGLIGTILDMTEKIKIEEQLRQAQKMDAIGRLAGGVAHDFNNMLSVIIGYVEIVKEDMEETGLPTSNLDEIHKAAKRSVNLTKQLLAFARKQTIEPKILHLNQVLEDMLKMMNRLIGEDIKLVWIPGKDLWPVKMDVSQIDQIIANLCVNARDAVKENGTVTIETGNIEITDQYCRDHPGFITGKFVMLAVSDDGSGMDKDTVKNLFEPFFTTKKKEKGTGLGLATIYGIVKQNNGFIHVYSEPGEGTILKIYLPVCADTQEAAVEKKIKETVPKGNETILLVEDETSILELTKVMIERFGYTVLAASTPKEAIQLAAGPDKTQIHLLLSDVVMPEMNGWELSKELLCIYPDLKCLFMSGYTANVIVHHGILKKGVYFIDKPFSRRDLGIKIRQILDN